MLQNEYPALWRFLGAYLHQDWREEYETPSQALEAFLSGEPDMAQRLTLEIQAAVSKTSSSVDLERLMVELGSGFLPSTTGTDAREWMRNVQQEIDTILGTSPTRE